MLRGSGARLGLDHSCSAVLMAGKAVVILIAPLLLGCECCPYFTLGGWRVISSIARCAADK